MRTTNRTPPAKGDTAPRLDQDPDPHFAAFLFLLLLIPSFLYLVIFALALTPNPLFDRFGRLNSWAVLSFPYHLHQVNADVVIFGDSSAFFGIDPRILNAQLGLRTLVLPDTVGALPVTGDMPLRHYLAENPAPRLIVFYFSAWNLDFEQTGEQHLFLEGEALLLRYGSRADLASFARRYPAKLLTFPWQFASTLGLRHILEGFHPRNEDQLIAQALGHQDYPETQTPLAPTCIIPGIYLARSNSASVQSLVRRYSSPRTRVLVYLAPIPACQNANETARHTGAVLGAQPPHLLPASAFAADNFYAHILPAQVPASSRLLADAISSSLSP